jgi:hypothetical protein
VRVGKVFLALAGASVLAAGCGTVHAGSGGNPVSLSAAVQSTSAQSARIAVTTTVRMGSMSVSYTESGIFDFAHARGEISMQTPMNMTELFLPPKTYIKLSGAGGPGLPKGKSWMELDSPSLGSAAVPGLSPFGATSPANLLTALTALSAGTVKNLGASTVRGVAVTGYRVTIDQAKLLQAAKVPAALRAGYRQFITSLGTGSMSANIWVDSGNLVRRVTFTFKLSTAMSGGMSGAMGGTAGKAPQMTETTDFYDFGVPVHLSAPPAAQIGGLSQFISQSGSVISSSGSSGSSGNSGSGVSVGTGGIFGSGSTPPPASGTLTPDQAAAAEQAIAAFFAALAKNNSAALAATIVPSQRSCVTSGMNGAPTITVKSLRILSARPDGTGKATVLFTVSLTAKLGGTNIPIVGPNQAGQQQWLVATETGGHWYMDPRENSSIGMVGAC